MKVGDLVNIVGSWKPKSKEMLVGTIVAQWKIDEWWEVLIRDGEVIHWPESQMEVVNESR